MSDVEENNFDSRGSRSQSKSPMGTPAGENWRAGQDLVVHQGFPNTLNPILGQDQNPGQGQEGILTVVALNPTLTLIGEDLKVGHIHQNTNSEGAKVTFHCLTQRRHTGSRTNPDPNTCLGVFGLSLYTIERDLREVFSRYGPLSGVNVVYDQRTGCSRGFVFVYFERIDDSKEAMERANGMELGGRRIRVDYSIPKRAHTPTPGIYMGRPTRSGGGGGGGGGGGRCLSQTLPKR
uniref:RRM domain-containing protein n=1 Tax=Sciurus vulgaris TaxID=55149 RepID=A0A8D2DPF2_SCIVU